MEEDYKTNIDYIGLLRYLNEYQEIAYSDPDTEGLDEYDKERLTSVKENGDWAVSQLSAIASVCHDRFDISVSQPITWLDGSKTKTRKTLCLQMKYDDYFKNPSSISLYVEKNGEAAVYYRISLDISDGFSKKQIENYHSYLDLPIDSSSRLVLAAKTNMWGNPEVISDSPAEAKSKIEKKQYRKVQLCWFVQRKSDESNSSIQAEIMKAIEALLPYYQHVLGFDSQVYWPSKDEYDPGISVEEWITLLQDPEVTREENLRMFAMMIDQGGEATCTKLAEVYGGKYASYNNYGRIFGERVHRKTGCPPCPDGDTVRYFPIPFVGRHVIEDNMRRYSWKLRDELFEALKSIELPDIHRKGKTNMKQFGLNTILYGPPGTGKTYNTVRYAVAICEPGLDVWNMEYADVLDRFNALKEKGQIDFVTFHQSYGYEEFIEGLKPVLIGEDNDEIGDIKYNIVPGVFKKFCNRARSVLFDEAFYTKIGHPSPVWLMSIADEHADECFRNDQIRLDSSLVDDSVLVFNQNCKEGDIILVTNSSKNKVIGIAVLSNKYMQTDDDKRDCWDVCWYRTNINDKLSRYTEANDIPDASVIRVNAQVSTPEEALYERLYEQRSVKVKPYVFIIDEINRGNISKIFGELITLIESTKRYGADEAMETTLPYSGESFSVPNNAYILGTMNTADRSIAIMDTALRRRFEFKEMMPEIKVLDGITVSSGGETLDISEMLATINERIEYLFDREHTIGHAFFTSLRTDPSLKNLAMIFKTKVVPLLQEYFYEDYEKIQLVLGDNGKSDSSYKFVLDERADERKLFKGVPDLDIKEKKYSIQESAFELIQSYIEIM